MSRKITKTYWLCDQGHEHTTKAKADACERKSAPADVKESRQKEREKRFAENKEKREAAILERRRGGHLVPDGEYAGMTRKLASCLSRAGLTPSAAAKLTTAQLLCLPGFGRGAQVEFEHWRQNNPNA